MPASAFSRRDGARLVDVSLSAAGTSRRLCGARSHGPEGHPALPARLPSALRGVQPGPLPGAGWAELAGISSGPVFRPVSTGNKAGARRLAPWAVNYLPAAAP
jgi:hypothetical protein